MITASEALVFDTQFQKRRRKRASGQLKEHAFLADWAATHLIDRLLDVKRSFPIALQLGCGLSSNAQANLNDNVNIETLIQADICADCLNETVTHRVQHDEACMPFAHESLDLIISPVFLHNVNDLPGMLTQIRHTLKPDGLFLAAMLGGETLYELRHVLRETELSLKGGVSPRVSPFADKPQMSMLMQRAGFALPVVDSDIVTATYPDMFKLMHDLRAMGESNAVLARSKHNPGKAFFHDANALYRERFSDPDGRIHASFEVIFLIGWAPHDSQQKPLRPGSAEQRLADALQTIEIKAGDKATP